MEPTPRARGGPGQVIDKYCPKARTYSVHDEHSWEHKEDHFFCPGILPYNEQPPCQVIDGPNKKVCGEAAPISIKVRGELVNAFIDVCPRHKSRYDSEAKRLRMSTKSLPQAS